MLRFKHYKKSYGRMPVLMVDDLLVGPGLYWIQGSNGSGKSSLLKTMAGILSFDGDITLDDFSIKQHPIAYRRRVNFAEAEPIFPEFLTGQDMINLFITAKHGSDRHAQQLAESIEIDRHLHQPLRSYSSGMLKKLSLLLSFLGRPRVILLDEPLITLDTNSVSAVYQWIRHAQQQDETSFFLSSHQPLQPMALPAAQIIVIEQKTVTFAK